MNQSMAHKPMKSPLDKMKSPMDNAIITLITFPFPKKDRAALGRPAPSRPSGTDGSARRYIAPILCRFSR